MLASASRRASSLLRASSSVSPVYRLPPQGMQPSALRHMSLFSWLRDNLTDQRTHVGTDELGNKYYVEKLGRGRSTNMVAQTSHVKEVRSVEFSDGRDHTTCELLPCRQIPTLDSCARACARTCTHSYVCVALLLNSFALRATLAVSSQRMCTRR